ncbi:peptide chain release factor 1 [archaeon CG10_big_fil_rev_8_21_14_0_10_43_11]|nr:MAG: peptide chain release factor 1 [archaeon CG10_big_fil_rev_8_21_14_0_10_43_11]
MQDKDIFKLKKLLKKLEAIRGRGTELISVYIPDEYNINIMSDQLSTERSMAVNIKSKSTRKNVLAALEKILGELKKYQKTPQKGMIIFCGNTGGDRVDIEMWVIQPPEKLNTKMYRCDQVFWLDPLKDMIADKEEYLLVSIDRSEVGFGILKGKHVELINVTESHIPGKMRAGGQSAARFMRARQSMKEAFLKDSGDFIKEVMLKRKLKKIILGGPGHMKEELNDARYLSNHLQNVVGLVDTGYAGEDGFEELLQKSQDLLKNEALMEEKVRLNKFFSLLGARSSKVSYGMTQTKALLEQGLVEEIFVSESVGDDLIEEINEIALAQGSAILVASTETREGESLKQIGGIGAILRYAL